MAPFRDAYCVDVVNITMYAKYTWAYRFDDFTDNYYKDRLLLGVF